MRSRHYSERRLTHNPAPSPTPLPEREEAEALRVALHALADLVRDCNAPGTVLAVLVLWMTDLRGRPIGGRSGEIAYLCARLKRSDDTICRALHQINSHPVLGQALHYKPKHAGDPK